MTPLTHESLHAQLQCFGRRACAGRALHAGPHRQRVVQAHGSEGTGAARARPRSRGEEVEAVCQWAKRRAGPARGRTRDPLPGRPAEPRLLDRGCVAVAGDAQLGLLRSALHASPDGIPPVHLRALQRMGAARCAGCPTRAAGAARSQHPITTCAAQASLPGAPGSGCGRLASSQPLGDSCRTSVRPHALTCAPMHRRSRHGGACTLGAEPSAAHHGLVLVTSHQYCYIV